MRFTFPLIGLASMLVSSIAVSAEEGPWSGSAAVGYLATSGNADNTSANGNFKLGYDAGSWHHSMEARAVGASAENETTAEAYGFNAKSKYDLSEFNYVFGLVDWKKDRFSGYDQQISEQVGYGRRLLNTERYTWNAEIGAGARQSDLRDGTKQNETTVRGATDFTWQISETAEFGQALIIESGADNTFIESVSAVKAQLVGSIALVASYTIRRNSSVPVGSEKQDTFTALSLEYAF
jgi:putative salt-induced outer membrane protein